MKTRNLTLLVTLCILLLLGTVLLQMPQFAVTNRSNDPIPYIYYFSDLHRAWVVERADGTDSRLIGQGIMPEQYPVIDSVQWSPSGEWLAWRGHQWREGGGYPTHGGLASSGGDDLSHLLERDRHVFLMEWAPDKDWLVLGFSESPAATSLTIRLIDVPNQRIVIEMTQHGFESFESWIRMPLAWANDGQALYFTFNRFPGALLTRLEISGHVENWVFDSNQRLIDFHQERLMQYRLQRIENVFQHEWLITDLSTGEEYIFASFSEHEAPENVDYDLNWNESGTYALVTEKECNPFANYRCEVIERYLLDWNQQRHYPISSGFQIAVNTSYHSDGISSWSPTGRYALMEDFSLNLFLLDTESREVFEFGFDKNRDWFWLANDDLVFWGGQSQKIFHFSIERLELNEILYEGVPNMHLNDISPDASMLGFQSFGVIVENLASGEFYTFPSHSLGAPVTDYLWGENGAWFFSGSNTVFAGGGMDSRAIMIHHPDEATGRELTLCSYLINRCAGFLPERVLPHLARGQAESFTPAPEHILLHDKSVTGLGWSPDGSRLASFASTSHEDTTISIWNMQADAPYLETSYETDLYCNNHPVPCKVFWEGNSEFYYEGQQRVLDNSGYYINLNYIETYKLAENTVHRIEGDISYDWESPVMGDYRLEFSDEQLETALLYHQPSQTLVSSNPLEQVFAHSFFDFDYHPETNLLVSPNIYRRGKLWDVATGEQIAELNWTGYAAAFSPDGRSLAVASSAYVSIWDMSEYIDNR